MTMSHVTAEAPRNWRERRSVAQFCRPCTASARRRAVERVIAALHERYAEPITLDEMARIAISSRFHFSRMFRQTTGVSPCQFLAALRLEAAKRLLVTSPLSVTEICMAVGYSSLGTFTTQFTGAVGASPLRLRQLSRAGMCASGWRTPPEAERSAGRGRVRAGSPGAVGPVMVGLFCTPIPRGRPAACCQTDAVGEFRIPALADGRYFACAAALDDIGDICACLTAERAPRGRAGPFDVRRGEVSGEVEILLRPPELIDPPLLVALPALLLDRAAGRARAHPSGPPALP
jgi:AraC family transcriptional regulator